MAEFHGIRSIVAIAAIAALFVSVFSYSRDIIVGLRPFEYIVVKLNHVESLALDRIAHYFALSLELQAKVAKFHAWIGRVMNHPDFVGGHFDPGRMPA